MEEIRILICGLGRSEYLALKEAFEQNGMDTVHASNGHEAWTIYRRAEPALALIDASLFQSGDAQMFFSALRDSRLLTAVVGRSDGRTEISFLRAGADAYMARPLWPDVAVARVRAMLRRGGSVEEERHLELAELSIYPESFRVLLSGRELTLTPGDFKCLCCLAEAPGKVLSREQLQNSIWGYEYYGSPRAIDTQIKRLRRALCRESVHFAITSVYGVGYKLDILA